MDAVNGGRNSFDQEDGEHLNLQDEDAKPDDFTLRAVLGGLFIGCLLAFTNLYFGLQSGWVSMMSLQASLGGFALFRALPTSFSLFGKRFTLTGGPLTPEENTVLQTTAAAVGIMPLSAGLVGVIPALTQLDPSRDGSGPIVLGFLPLIGWCVALAYFGVFFAAPLRHPMIIKEKLVFPSGTATAQLIGVLHRIPLDMLSQGKSQKQRSGELRHRTTTSRRPSHGQASIGQENCDVSAERISGRQSEYQHESRSNGDDAEQGVMESGAGWKTLLWSFAGSAMFTILSYFFPVLYAMPIFDVLSPTHDLAATWGWWFTPSLSYIGQGIIMGLDTTVSMTAGAIVGWGVLSPLSSHKGWAPGAPMDSDQGSRGWILWISLAIMCSESIISLLSLAVSNGISDIRYWLAARRERHAQYSPLNVNDPDSSTEAAHPREDNVDEEHEPPSRLTPLSYVLWGLGGSTLLAIGVLWATFGRDISPWATCLAIVLGSIFAVLGIRALGETDLNPVSGIGKLSQLIFAVVHPGVVSNIVAGGIAEAGASQAGELMQDYKTGHLVGSSPRGQFFGQLAGSTLGIFISTLAYKLYTSSYPIPGPQFPAPTAAIWLNLARLVNHGHLPEKTGIFMLEFGAIFAVTGLIRTLARNTTMKRERQGVQGPLPHWVTMARFLPSGIAFAVGILNTPNFSLARLCGGVIAHLYAKRRAQQGSQAGTAPFAGIFIIVIASGFVLGEGIASIVTLLMTQAGADVATCWGCRGGCSGGCN